MDITKGRLDDISRPASNERPRPGSRMSCGSPQDRVRVNQDSPRCLVVLNPDVPGTETRVDSCQKAALEKDSPVSFEDQTCVDGRLMESFQAEAGDGGCSGPFGEHLSESEGRSGFFYTDISDEENKDPALQEAIKKMKRLDKILAQKISKEKAVKALGKELQQRLWNDFLELKTKPEHADEAENTRLYLSLGSTISYGSNEDWDFVPIFGTQIAHDGHDGEATNLEEGQSKAADCPDRDLGETVSDSLGSGRHKVIRGKKNKDFIKKNIELVQDAGSQVLMTQAEKERLAELLRDLDECNTSPTGDEGDPSLWALHVLAGEGYTPEPEELDQLCYIDSRLQVLLPVENFLSVCSPYFGHNTPQGPGAGRSFVGDRLPGEKVLQDIRETRGQEARLKEIEEQLEHLGREQESTLGSPPLHEEQLRTLLEDCSVSLKSSPFSVSTEDDVSPGAAGDRPSSLVSVQR